MGTAMRWSPGAAILVWEVALIQSSEEGRLGLGLGGRAGCSWTSGYNVGCLDAVRVAVRVVVMLYLEKDNTIKDSEGGFDPVLSSPRAGVRVLVDTCPELRSYLGTMQTMWIMYCSQLLT